jgi:hypothetical protein
MIEEIGSMAQAVSLPESCVILFSPLLYVKHCGAEVIGRQTQRIDTDEQNIAALGKQLT